MVRDVEGDARSAQDADGSVEVERPTDEARELFGIAFAGAERFAEMLAAEGGLHIVNSAAVVPFLPARGTVADVGSGAGFPGIVVALLRPDLEVALIEIMERRMDWLGDVVNELDLDNVTLQRARAEDVKERFDAVTARAVANLTKLVRLTAPLLRQGGSLLALKGARAEVEVEAARHVVRKAGLKPAVIHEVVTPGEELTKVVQVRRPRR